MNVLGASFDWSTHTRGCRKWGCSIRGACPVQRPCRGRKGRELNNNWQTLILDVAPYTAIWYHYNDVIMSAPWRLKSLASRLFAQPFVQAQIRENKHQSSASLAFVRGIHRWPGNSPHKRPVRRQMFPFDDVIMTQGTCQEPGLRPPADVPDKPADALQSISRYSEQILICFIAYIYIYIPVFNSPRWVGGNPAFEDCRCAFYLCLVVSMK